MLMNAVIRLDIPYRIMRWREKLLLRIVWALPHNWITWAIYRASEQEKHLSVCLVTLVAEYQKLQTEIEMLRIELSGCNGTLDMEREHLKITEAELSKAETRMAATSEILNEPFVSGTRIVNCIAHSAKQWEERPMDCKLCRTDITNHLSYCYRVNDYLRDKISKACVIGK